MTPKERLKQKMEAARNQVFAKVLSGESPLDATTALFNAALDENEALVNAYNENEDPKEAERLHEEIAISEAYCGGLKVAVDGFKGPEAAQLWEKYSKRFGGARK